MNSIMPWVAAAVIAFVLGSMAYIDHLHSRVDRLTIERNIAIADREAADRAIDALAAERAAADARASIVSNSREAIISAPSTEDGPVAPLLQRALDAADQIGGLQ